MKSAVKITASTLESIRSVPSSCDAAANIVTMRPTWAATWRSQYLKETRKTKLRNACRTVEDAVRDKAALVQGHGNSTAWKQCGWNAARKTEWNKAMCRSEKGHCKGNTLQYRNNMVA
jgi:hypothetical protein